MRWLEKRRAKKTAKKEKLRMEEQEKAKEAMREYIKKKEADEWRERADENYGREYDAGMERGYTELMQSKLGGRTRRTRRTRRRTYRRKGTQGARRSRHHRR